MRSQDGGHRTAVGQITAVGSARPNIPRLILTRFNEQNRYPGELPPFDASRTTGTETEKGALGQGLGVSLPCVIVVS